MRLHPILSVNRIASGAIAPYRILQLATLDDRVEQAAADARKFAGVSGQLSALDGERLDLHVQGIAPVEYGGTVANGDPLTSDSLGRAVKAGAGDTVLGTAQESGTVDEIGSVLLGAGGPGAQVVTGTLVAGECVIDEGITVTAGTLAFPTPSAAITGSTNFAGLAHIVASNVAGGPGTGSITIRALGANGATDADAAGTFQALLLG